MTEERKYNAIFFKQPGNEDYVMATFVVGISDLVDWVGIPRKRVKDTSQILFQRALEDQRLEKIKKHFAHCVSPNSILLTLREGAVNNISEILNSVNNTKESVIGELVINSIENNLSLEEKLLTVISLIEDRLTLDEVVSNGEISEDSADYGEQALLENDVINDVHSHLGDTLSFIKDFKSKLDNRMNELSESELQEMEDFCTDYLKPAFLVDGQHRTFGANEKVLEEFANGNQDFEILIPVSAIINSDWKESVFQFVIINQTAQKIDNKFLSSIISTSLTDEELSHFRGQLEISGAPVSEALILNQLYTTNFDKNGENINPFYRNIEFAVPEEPINVLRYSTVKTLVNRIRTFSDGNTAVFGRPYENLKGLVLNLEISEEDWKERYWFQFIIYFWHLARARFTSENILQYLPRTEKDGEIIGSNLSLKLSMQFIQDHFVSYITRNQQLLTISGNNLEILSDILNYDKFENIFNLWCGSHNNNYEFFEAEWNGLSEYKREPDKYEGINNAWEMDQFRRSKLFRG